ncbi:hypothetical protein QQX98_008248 [Neonectria punicea]|uniref:DUF6594 domain-containing protein n=1 Tax=Neonectria punicea TaxID=979145 RepID=A0ABR1GW49_9HYPO
MSMCGRNASGSADLADQPRQDTPNDHDGESTTRNADLEARGSHEEVLKGLIGLSVHRRNDAMYLFGRRFRQQGAYGLDTMANRVVKVWEEIVQTIERNGPGLDELNKKFFDALVNHHKMLLLINQVEGLVKPNGKSLRNFLDAVTPDLEPEDARFLHAPREDWAMACPMEPMDRWVKLAPEYSVGRFFCSFFEDKKTTRESFESYDYPDKAFGAVVMTLSHLVLVALVGIPVVIQSLDILSTAGNAAMYLGTLFLFIALAQLVVPNESVQFLMSLAFAAVMATNLGRGC